MISKAIEKIEKLAAPNMPVINGVTYSDKKLEPVLPLDYRPDVMVVHTLSGLIDYVIQIEKENRKDKLFAHVVTYNHVDLYGEYSGVENKRTYYIKSLLDEFSGFKFNQFQQHEVFMIGIQTLFVPNTDLDRLIKTIGKMKNESSLESNDDGVTQTIRTSKGISGHTTEGVKIENPFELKPYRAFPEVDQPESLFILRVQGKEGQTPTCGLFESDGAAWKLTAIQTIKNYLNDKLMGTPIIA